MFLCVSEIKMNSNAIYPWFLSLRQNQSWLSCTVTVPLLLNLYSGLVTSLTDFDLFSYLFQESFFRCSHCLMIRILVAS